VGFDDFLEGWSPLPEKISLDFSGYLDWAI